MNSIPGRTIGRLSLYRRLLFDLQKQDVRQIYSHELATKAGVTPAQVRRDIMSTGYTGSPSRGYNVTDLIDCIGGILDSLEGEGVALIGVGNLGRAILSYFAGRRPKLSIVAAFDVDESKTNRVIHGCRCHHMSKLPQVVREQNIKVAIIAVSAEQAQEVAEQLILAGIRGLLNFAPTPLRVPEDVYVEHNDITMSLEKVAFFARQANAPRNEGAVAKGN